MRRLLRRAFVVLAILAVLPVVALALVLAVANTEWGLAQLARLAQAATAGTSTAIAIDGLHGRFPDRLAVARIAVSDPDGPWLIVDDAALSWSPLDLLRGRATVDAVTAARVALLRAPHSTGPAAEGDGGLPVSVDVRRLEIGRLEVPIGVGAPALALHGNATLDGARARVHLAGDALDGARGAYVIDAALDDHRISATIAAEEPASEALGAVLGLVERPPLSFSARIDGPRNGAVLDASFVAGALRVDGDGWLDLVHMAGDVRLAASSAAMAPIAGIRWSSATVAATLSGPFAAPTVDATIDVSQLAVGGVALSQLRIAASAAGVPERIQAHLSAVAEQVRVPGPTPDVLSSAPIEIEATAVLAHDTMELADAQVRHPLLSVRAQGTASAANLSGMLSIDVASLRPVLAAAGQSGEGTLQLEVALSGTVAAPTLMVTARGGVSDGPPSARALLGPDARLRATIAADAATRRATVSALRLEGAAMILEGEASLSADALAANWHLQFVELGVLDTGVTGALDATGTVAGRPDDLAVNVRLASAHLARNSLILAPFAADVAVLGLPASPVATVRIEGQMNDAPLLIAGRAAAPPDGPWTATLERAALPGLSGHGEASGLGAVPQTATLALDAADLAPLGTLLGVRLRGAATVNVALRQPAGSLPDARPEGTVEAQLRDVAVNNVVAIGAASLRAGARETGSDPVVSVQLAAERIAAGGVNLATMRVEVDGLASAMGARLTADGTDVEMRLSGTIRANDGATIELAPGTMRWRRETVGLQGPARIALGDGVRIVGLRFGLRGGSVAAEGRVGGSGNDLRVTIARLPLALAEMAVPNTPLSGSIDGELRLQGTLAAPQGQLRATVRDARVTAGTPRLLPPVNATIAADLAGDSARIDVSAQAGAATRLRAQGRVPLQPSGSVDLRVTGAVDLAMTDLFLAAQGRLMRGRATIDATLRGSASQPAIVGAVTIADGRLEDAVNGLRISGLGGSLSFRDQALQVGPLRGQIGGGSIVLAGQVGVLEPGMPVDLRLTTRGGRVVDSPIATVAADADITVRGRVAEDITASGPITVHRAEFRIAEALPPNLPTLQVREVGGTAQQRSLTAARNVQTARAAPPARAARNGRRPPAANAVRPAAGPPVAAAGPRVLLDIPITMPRAVFVRGRGLEAEVGGNLRLRGTAAAPSIEGVLGLRRGAFEVAGQRLAFRRGTLSFDPGVGIDPTLDLDASTTAGGVTANIHIGGRASAPNFALTSDPALPPDEILSHMLFGTATSGLSPLQVLRVASAVAELSGIGGGGDLTDRLRRGLGLDVLSVQDVSGGGVGGEAGRYVREGVYVGVRSGRSTSDGSQQTQGVVQIEVLPNVKVEAGAGTTGRIGVTYERDY